MRMALANKQTNEWDDDKDHHCETNEIENFLSPGEFGWILKIETGIFFVLQKSFDQKRSSLFFPMIFFLRLDLFRHS